jgi:peroxiredoxin/uncharacterized membrane protein YphA (DoxX/SURF4 family)
MDAGLLLARLLLAAVFAVAGVAKLADRPGTRQALLGFHVPEVLVPAGSFLLPLAELAVSLALLFTVSAWWGALGALALLLAFIVGIGISLARGEAPDCHCFGQIHSEPAGWSTILRNAVLLFIAGFVAWQGPGHVGPSTTDWMSRLTGGERVTLGTGLVLLATIATLGWFLFNLLRQIRRLVSRMESLESTIVSIATHGPELPSEATPAVLPVAPAFALPGLYGETVTLAYLLAPGKPLLLLFASADCGPCLTILTEAGRWQAENGARLTVVPIIQGTVEEARGKATQLALSNVLLHDPDVAEAYGAQTTPSGVLVNVDGTIGSEVAVGPDAISALFVDADRSSSLSADAPALLATSEGGQSSASDGAAEPADTRLLDVLMRSGEFQTLQERTADPRLVDSWQEDGLHFFTFGLAPADGEELSPEPATAVFVMRPGVDVPVSAVIVTPSDDGEPDVINLRGTGGGDTGPVSATGALGVGLVAASVEGEPAHAAMPPPEAGVALKAPAPDFALSGIGGEIVTLDEIRAPGRPMILLFANVGCGPCSAVLTNAARWQVEAGAQLTVVPIIEGGVEAANGKAAQLGLANVLLHDPKVAAAYGAHAMPSAILVNADGAIGSDVAAGLEAIDALYADTLNALPASGPAAEPAPGEEIDVAVMPEASISGASPNGHGEPPQTLRAKDVDPASSDVESGVLVGSADQSPAEHRSPADAALLAPLQRSGEYQAVRGRAADLPLIDSWQEEGLHFFVFLPEEMNGTESAAAAPTAVFVMRPGVDEPVSAVVVTPKDGEEPDIINLRRLDHVEGLTTIGD